MFHIVDHPDANWVHQQTKRRVGKSSVSVSISLVLLGQGLSVYAISEFDRPAFIENGIDYLKYYFQDRWNEH